MDYRSFRKSLGSSFRTPTLGTFANSLVRFGVFGAKADARRATFEIRRRGDGFGVGFVGTGADVRVRR